MLCVGSVCSYLSLRSCSINVGLLIGGHCRSPLPQSSVGRTSPMKVVALSRMCFSELQGILSIYKQISLSGGQF